GYVPPPGVLNQADRLGAELQLGSQQINEQSLRLLATDLRLNERAEAFVRFVDEADKNFLKYRALRHVGTGSRGRHRPVARAKGADRGGVAWWAAAVGRGPVWRRFARIRGL